MSGPERTPEGEALTETILELLRLTTLLLTQGDQLVAHLGLTSARWQVLGAIVAAERPQPVAWLARDMGGNRQNVQRIINDLAACGLVDFEENPHHRRAQLVVLTAEGRRAFDAAMKLQAPWINELVRGLSLRELQGFRRVIHILRENIDRDVDAASASRTRVASRAAAKRPPRR